MKELADQPLGDHLYPKGLYLSDEQDKLKIYEQIKDQTMIGALGVLANIDAIDYVCANKIPGCIVECGVWRGGSVASMLLRLREHNDATREIFLFDTFAGMTEPTSMDTRDRMPAISKYQENMRPTHNAWCYSPLVEVKANIARTTYPPELITYVEGDILKTAPITPIPQIAILRLDTDWYESTKAELKYLYPRVVKHGVTIIDDYGCWDGARQATKEYFRSLSHVPLLYRIDHTRRMFVKTDDRLTDEATLLAE